MADNYLERKMEELNAPRTNSYSKAHGSRIGLGWSLPKLRVAIIGDCSDLCHTIAKSYVAAGCRVSLIEPENDAATLLAREGLRYCKVNSMDCDHGAQALTSTISQWREIDVVVFCDTEECIAAADTATREYHRNFPAVSNYASRYILLTRRLDCNSSLARNAGNLYCYLNIIKLKTPEDLAKRTANAKDVARLCIFLSLSDSDFIRMNEIKISYCN